VNYDGNNPYARRSKGVYRKATVPVRSLPANDWGLYEMHGNVWEWCADGPRAYAERDETDPRGPEGQGVAGPAMLRGGSWLHAATAARSAFRGASAPPPDYLRAYAPHVFARAPDSASPAFGFRFALRSTSPAGAAERR
jgi:formylglycine-generating enzyme required for sulfatase activity